jgi:Bacterial EndoU nuclease
VTINPLVVARTGGARNAWSGIYLAEDIQTLHQGVVSGSWVDDTLGGVGAALDTLGLITDPLGTLASWGVAWLLDHVKPLSDALDKLAGDPAQISANAQTWANVSQQLAAASTGYADSTKVHLTGWNGTARTAYDTHAQEHVGVLGALSQAAATMGSIVQGAGELVALVRTLVRDAIAEFVSVLAVRLWEWLAEEAGTLGIGTPWVIAQVSALVAKWVDKIAHFFRGLISSLRRLGEVLRKLAHLIENLARRSVILTRVGKDHLLGRTAKDLDGMISPERLKHILTGEGDLTNLSKVNPGGGHMWPGLDGVNPAGVPKSVFPRTWTVADIKRNITDIVTDPHSQVFGGGAGGGPLTHAGNPARYRIYGTRDGVQLRIVWEPAGEGVISAFPTTGAPH